ncbi:MAG: helix-turn-helix domain-containing protein [Halioglobus sp.]|nr:helix-turn-helix domain-containing protein [Halioglobus sp.]
MPRNRSEKSREEKSAEIVKIAERLFLEYGYDGTTMAAIAREAGVASNVVHWYFPTKDELFVAVMEALQLQDMQEAAGRLADLSPARAREARVEILADFVCRRLDRHGLISTLHERSQHSDVVAGFHARVHRRYEQGLAMALEHASLPAAERKLVVAALITAIEGLIMHRASKAEARRMMSFLAERLIPPA